MNPKPQRQKYWQLLKTGYLACSSFLEAVNTQTKYEMRSEANRMLYEKSYNDEMVPASRFELTESFCRGCEFAHLDKDLDEPCASCEKRMAFFVPEMPMDDSMICVTDQGVEKHSAPFSLKEAKRLREDGWLWKQIGEALGYSGDFVRRRTQEAYPELMGGINETKRCPVCGAMARVKGYCDNCYHKARRGTL